MSSFFVHPKLQRTLAGTERLWNCRTTIEAQTTAKTAIGQKQNVWATIAGLDALPSRMATSGTGERKDGVRLEVELNTQYVLIRGKVDGIQSAMRAKVVTDDGSTSYHDILGVEYDSFRTMTRLRTKVAKI